MNQYDTLDETILNKLKLDGTMPLLFLNSGNVRMECDRIATATGREAFRILDGRLQKLRKSGVISFNRKTGWSA